MNPKSKGIQKTPPKAEPPSAIEPEVLPPSAIEPLLTPRLVQILVEKNDPAEIERLMKVELEYNKERMRLAREHAELHPDAIEERKTRAFRRTQYFWLMGLLPLLILAIPFVPLSVGSMFAIIAMLIVAAVLINGREREVDLPGLIKIINMIVRRKP